MLLILVVIQLGQRHFNSCGVTPLTRVCEVILTR